ncbi:YhgE/Pip domain-containing protein [Gordonia sp. CPCC 205333]|uniref:YhgE/Pip domain-containing protein n=1 Tax=Gordonia sp. CPCC 205333 TaxID=3140790 RepID=UPI003AF3E598
MGSHEKPENDGLLSDQSSTVTRAHVEDGVDEEQARRAIADVVGHPKFWLAPVAAVVGLMCLMAAMYMGAVVNPTKNLHNFPIALVNEDVGGSTAEGQPKQNFGDQIVKSMVPTAAKSGIVLTETDRTTALRDLNSGKAYGVVYLGPNFTNVAINMGRSAAPLIQIKPEQPKIEVYINRGSGTFASSITTIFAERVGTQVNAEFGKQMTATVRQQLAANNLDFSGAAQLALSAPVDVAVTEPAPLPDGSANGLSAFYFTLLLILAGFTGAMMVSVIVDGTLGQLPVEFGPLFLLRKRLPISRWGTLAAKWTIMLIIAALQSALYLAVCAAVGTSLPNSFVLWLFSVLAITAVGITASAMMAAFGNLGLILNLVFFVILGLPSSGGTVPLEASPRIFEWLAKVEPMHQVYVGVRAILYFDADFGAGFGESIVVCIVGLIVGLLLGVLVTKWYDRRDWHRLPDQIALPPRLAKLTE